MTGLKLGDRFVPQAEALDRAARAASGLAKAGVGPGDVIAIYLRNDFAFMEASSAAGQLGAYPTPVNWHNSPDEAKYIFENSGAKAIIIHSDLYHSVAGVIPKSAAVFVVETPPEIAGAYGLTAAQCALPEGVPLWNDVIAQNEPHKEVVEAAPGTMIYTSGTTGHPKGVRRKPPTEAQRQVTMMLIGNVFGLFAAEGKPIVTAVTGPMYHSAPNAYGGVMFGAGALTILEPRFDPEGLLQLIEKEKITHLHMVPTMFVRLLKLPDDVKKKYDLSSLKFVVHAAAPCPVHVKQAMIEWWGPVINEYYGGTETSAVVYCNSEDWLKHPGTVGKAVAGAEIRVLGENGEDLETGGVGEIICRIPAMADFTYHGDDEKRKRAEKKGLISLGDVGYLDADGFLYLCDRSKDMIISGGANIYPAEIEAELLKAPGVFDCAVFGIPDDEFGERVHAVVQPAEGAHPDPDDIRAFLKERMASYKVPKGIDFAAELPREDSGKIFKRKLREPYWERAGRRI